MVMRHSHSDSRGSCGKRERKSSHENVRLAEADKTSGLQSVLVIFQWFYIRGGLATMQNSFVRWWYAGITIYTEHMQSSAFYIGT